MRLVMGGVNGHYLRDIIEIAVPKTEEVLAAVAYAADSALLFEWCWDNKIPIKYYGRLDDGVAVSVPILTYFLERKSPNFVCRLVQHHHAKVIWWRGVGIYIGSANLPAARGTKISRLGVSLQRRRLPTTWQARCLSCLTRSKLIPRRLPKNC